MDFFHAKYFLPNFLVSSQTQKNQIWGENVLNITYRFFFFQLSDLFWVNNSNITTKITMKNDNYEIGIKYELPGKPLMCILTLGFPNADLALSNTFFPYKHVNK